MGIFIVDGSHVYVDWQFFVGVEVGVAVGVEVGLPLTSLLGVRAQPEARKVDGMVDGAPCGGRCCRGFRSVGKHWSRCLRLCADFSFVRPCVCSA